jgi:hypothetical protein
MRLPNTYFSVLLSGKFPAFRDHEGAFFIDRYQLSRRDVMVTPASMYLTR